MMPKRIQRRRVKGWKMPENTVYVGRGSKWGNEFVVGKHYARKNMEPGGGEKTGFVQDREHAVQLFRRFLNLETRIAAKIDIKGKDLACWCPLPKDGEPDHCHAAVLLKLANPELKDKNV